MCCGMKTVLKDETQYEEFISKFKKYEDEMPPKGVYYEYDGQNYIPILRYGIFEESNKDFYYEIQRPYEAIDSYKDGEIMRWEPGGGYLLNSLGESVKDRLWVSKEIAKEYTKDIIDEEFLSTYTGKNYK